jgi:prepilin-type processing-associated H-X9-DG protein
MALLVLTCVFSGLPLELVARLFVGWALFLWRVVPEARWNFDAMASALAFLGGVGISTHLFLRWLYAEWGREPGQPDDEPRRRWRLRNTAAVVGVLVLLFVAGMAATGVAHQVGWLMSGRESLVGNSGRIAARRAQSTNNLKQLALGVHNYAEVQDSYPAGGTFDTWGRPMHSWMTLILPHVEESTLFHQVNFSLPWDHSENSQAFRTVKSGYLNPEYGDRFDSRGFALSHYAGNVRVLTPGKALPFHAVTDGASNTILGGEVAKGFRAWGDPVNWRDPAKGINRSPEGFGGPYPGGANLMFVDGSVRFVGANADPAVLKSIATPSGGEKVSAEDD